jgi:phospholipid transport system substrate-binding protein
MVVTGAVAAEGPGPATANAEELVRSLGFEAINVLSNKSLTPADREKEFRRLFVKGFAVDRIGQFTLGRYWRTATDAEKIDYRELFRDYVVRTYLIRFNLYSGETLKISNSRPVKEGEMVVESVIERPSGKPPVRVDWIVVNTDGEDKIVDVVVQGVSMSITHRQEFAAVIQNGGGQVAALLSALRQRTQSADQGG